MGHDGQGIVCPEASKLLACFMFHIWVRKVLEHNALFLTIKLPGYRTVVTPRAILSGLQQLQNHSRGLSKTLPQGCTAGLAIEFGVYPLDMYQGYQIPV